MFTAVDSFLTTTNVALSFCNLGFSLKDLFNTTAELLGPAWGGDSIWGRGGVDGLNGRGSAEGLDDLRDSGAGCAGDRSGGDATRGTDEKLSFTSGDFSLSMGHCAFTSDEGGRALGGEEASDTTGLLSAARGTSSRGKGNMSLGVRLSHVRASHLKEVVKKVKGLM